MTHKQIAARLRALATRKPTDIWRELHALAVDLEQMPEPVAAIAGPLADDDIEALMRVIQPPTSRRRLRLVPWGRR